MNEDFREPIIQNEDCIDKINRMLMHRKILFDGTTELNINGSNEEKISGIIKNMDFCPLEALKASSLLNVYNSRYLL